MNKSDFIDLTELNAIHLYIYVEVKMMHDDLFGKVVNYTMEELGPVDFFDQLREVIGYDEAKMGRWFVSGSRHYSWDKVNIRIVY